MSDDLETWHTAKEMSSTNWHKLLPWADPDLFYSKVNFVQ